MTRVNRPAQTQRVRFSARVSAGYQLHIDGRSCVGQCAVTSNYSQLKSLFSVLEWIFSHSQPCVCVFIDIDECKLQNGGCSHDCTNTPGGHQCHCPFPLLLDHHNIACVSTYYVCVL